MADGTTGPADSNYEAAARELESLGARRLRPYLCARSRHGHYHLTTDRAAVPVQRRIPPQVRPVEATPTPHRAESVQPMDHVSALHRRIPRQARHPQAATPLHIPQQRRPA